MNTKGEEMPISIDDYTGSNRMVSFKHSDDPAIRSVRVEKNVRISAEDQLKNLTALLDQFSAGHFEFQHSNYNVVDLADTFATKTLDYSYWKALFVLYLRRWNFNTESALSLFAWGAEGHNWKNLHPNNIESNWTFEEAEGHFYTEVNYCSDRMSFDRLFRCHWYYNHMMMRKAR